MHEKIERKLKSHPPLSSFDKLVLVASFAYPLMGVPQIFKVFDGNCQGVSEISWLSFTFFSVLFLVYGIRHKVMPMIITYSLWVVVNGLVTLGALNCGTSWF